MTWWYGQAYETTEQKRRKALRRIEQLRTEYGALKPVSIEGRALAKSFWGKAWCKHMDLLADHDNRLPRGRGYVRHGAVCHLDIRPGEVEAWVSGTRMYTVTLRFSPLSTERWEGIKNACKGALSTLLDLLRGKLSKDVMALVSDPEKGIFPDISEVSMSCSCPDWAQLCKHISAVLYGIGCRLDEAPELLFLLRGVDPQDLFSLDLTAPAGGDALQGVELGALFGIDLATRTDTALSEAAGRPAPSTPAQALARGGKERRKAAPPKHGGITPQTQPPLDFDHVTGDDVAAFRKAAGLTQQEFAFRLEMTRASVQRWENESAPLRLHGKTLDKLRAFYKKWLRAQRSREKTAARIK